MVRFQRLFFVPIVTIVTCLAASAQAEPRKLLDPYVHYASNNPYDVYAMTQDTIGELPDLHDVLPVSTDMQVKPVSFQQSSDCCEQTCRDLSAFHLGAAVTFLRPHQSGGRTAGLYDYEPAPRIWAGWTSPSGLGFRGRWFEYYAANPGGVGAPGIDGFYAMTTDLEVTDRFSTGCWDGLISAGVRYAELEEDNAPNFTGYSGSIGPLLGFELHRHWSKCVNLFSIGRLALLFGDCQSPHGVYGIAEIQLGAEWRRPLCGNSHWFVRGGWEGQWWPGASFDGSEDFGLIGGFGAIGINL